MGRPEFGYCNTRCVDCKNATPPWPRWGAPSKEALSMLYRTDARLSILLGILYAILTESLHNLKKWIHATFTQHSRMFHPQRILKVI